MSTIQFPINSSSCPSVPIDSTLPDFCLERSVIPAVANVSAVTPSIPVIPTACPCPNVKSGWPYLYINKANSDDCCDWTIIYEPPEIPPPDTPSACPDGSSFTMTQRSTGELFSASFSNSCLDESNSPSDACCHSKLELELGENPSALPHFNQINYIPASGIEISAGGSGISFSLDLGEIAVKHTSFCGYDYDYEKSSSENGLWISVCAFCAGSAEERDKYKTNVGPGEQKPGVAASHKNNSRLRRWDKKVQGGDRTYKQAYDDQFPPEGLECEYTWLDVSSIGSAAAAKQCNEDDPGAPASGKASFIGRVEAVVSSTDISVTAYKETLTFVGGRLTSASESPGTPTKISLTQLVDCDAQT